MVDCYLSIDNGLNSVVDHRITLSPTETNTQMTFLKDYSIIILVFRFNNQIINDYNLSTPNNHYYSNRFYFDYGSIFLFQK
jgi:hypothetical protein